MFVDLASIFIIVSIAQGLFFLFLSSRLGTPNKTTGWLLAAIVMTLLWFQTEFLLIRNAIDASLPLVYGTRYGGWLVFGPLIWLYLVNSFQKAPKFNPSWLIHFFPFFLFVLLLPQFSSEILTWRSVHYGMLTVFDEYNSEPISFFQYLYGIVFAVQFFHALIYLLKAYSVLRGAGAALKSEQSTISNQTIQLNYSFLLLTLLVILAVSGFIGFLFFTGSYRKEADYMYILPMTALQYLLLYQAIRQPNKYFLQSDSNSNVKYEKSSLPAKVAHAYFEKLSLEIKERKLYLNRGLTLAELSEVLDISVHHLSQSINQSTGRNFYDFINALRVEEAKLQIKSEQEKTLLQIAFAVGFNNKTSFVNAFKKNVGMTPSAFRSHI